MLSFKVVFALFSFWLSLAQAQLTITEPSSDRWWVAQSTDTLRWTCNTSPYTNWTVLITNSDANVLSGPLALIAIRKYNYDCSKSMIPGEQLKPGTGYMMQFANPFNNTDVFASSQPFEVKAVGSTYPPEYTSTESFHPTGSATGPGPSSTSSSGTNGAVAHGSKIALTALAGLATALLIL